MKGELETNLRNIRGSDEPNFHPPLTARLRNNGESVEKTDRR